MSFDLGPSSTDLPTPAEREQVRKALAISQQKTAAEWASDNTVLDAAEKGYETDTGKLKIGDGSTAWNSLGYFGAQGVETLDVTYDNLAANTITVVGPALAQTLPDGDGNYVIVSIADGETAGTGNNDSWRQVAVADSDGGFQFKISLEEFGNLIPEKGELGLKGGRLSVGDGLKEGGRPIPYTEDIPNMEFFQHTLTQDEWRKAAKFTSVKSTAVLGTIKSTTGYIKCLDHDGTWKAVVGDGIANNFKFSNFTASGDNTPRFYAIVPCDASGNLSGDLTVININSNQLTSFDGTGLSSLGELYLYSNQLTSFDGTGLSSLTDLHLHNNQLTSFDGTGLSSLGELRLNNNQLTSFDGTGLSSLGELYLSNNQLTSFDGTALSSLGELYLHNNQLTSFDGTGLSSALVIHLYNNQLTSFDGTGLSSLAELRLYNNQLTSFDGTGLSSLTDLRLDNNQLTSFDGTGLSSLTIFDISNNQLTSFLVGDLQMEDRYSHYTALDLSNQQLDVAALDTIYADLPDGDSYGSYSNTIDVTGNPGAGAGSGTDPSVATAKGWTVVGDLA